MQVKFVNWNLTTYQVSTHENNTVLAPSKYVFNI